MDKIRALKIYSTVNLLCLMLLANGAFKPKKLKREKVKEVLLSFRRNLQSTARSECTESNVTTFEYI